VDFAAKHLSVTRSIVSQVVGVCKTEASQKPVRLHESLAQALLEWRRHTSFRKREDWVFASPHSNGKRPYWAQPIMRYHVAPASLPRRGESNCKSALDGTPSVTRLLRASWNEVWTS